jgi:UDP-glucuronate 4-epimerase
MSAILVTGAAGFIGSWVAEALAARGDAVVGVDNFNDYYDPSIKRDRAKRLKDRVPIHETDIADYKALERIFDAHRFDKVCHLAAQAGVRYSLTNPFAYETANGLGTLNVLELCRHKGVKTLVYASSSSVYGGNKKIPFSVDDPVDQPISLYAATKKYNELMAHTYHHLYGLRCTGLRFFTVYGPWGRPDMALFRFTKAILAGETIDIYNHGNMLRDFTYVDDIIEGLVRVMRMIPKPDGNWNGNRPDPGTSFAPYRIYNIGGSQPVRLMDFIEALDDILGMKAGKNMLPLQKGDVVATCADAQDLENAVDFRPCIPVTEGIRRFVEWYRSYYEV